MLRAIRLGVIVCLTSLVMTAPQSASGESLWTLTRQHYETAMAAYQAEDFASYASTMKELAALRPDHPTVLYNTSSACALNQEPALAIHWMRTFAEMGLVADPVKDSDFASLVDNEEWKAVLVQIDRNREPTGTSQVAFTVPEKELLPEGIAFDSKTGDFFMSSVRQKKVLRIANGEVIEFRSSGDDGLWSVFALLADAERRHLWVCTAAMANTPGVTADEIGRSAVLVYDLDRAKLLRKVVLPKDDQIHVLNDLVLTRDGAAYLTDNQSGKIYILQPGSGTLVEMTHDAVMRSPQGIILSPDETHLYVADYSTGVHRISVKTGKSSALSPVDSASLIGIDGLIAHGQQFIAIQNGVRPHRVLRIELNTNGDTIENVSVLEANNPEFNEPTLGLVANGWLYYVANSQWGSLTKDGGIKEGFELSDPTVLKLEL